MPLAPTVLDRLDLTRRVRTTDGAGPVRQEINYMELHSILLAVLAAICMPMLYAYWMVSRKTNAAHLELLVKRDRKDESADLKSWNRLERIQTALGIGYLVMLLVWGAIQITSVHFETTLDKVFVWTFALSYVGMILVGEHYKLEDLANSMGFGQRARLDRNSPTIV